MIGKNALIILILILNKMRILNLNFKRMIKKIWQIAIIIVKIFKTTAIEVIIIIIKTLNKIEKMISLIKIQIKWYPVLLMKINNPWILILKIIF